jgi:hypothetical protein
VAGIDVPELAERKHVLLQQLHWATAATENNDGVHSERSLLQTIASHRITGRR